MQAKWLEVLLVMLYLGALLVLGLLARRKSRNSNAFLNASGELPLWICSVACIAANCGSLDVVMTMAFAAQYGIVAAHFYWIGAIPALLLLAFWLLPIYARGKYRSILDLVADHYGKQTGTLIAVAMAVMMLMVSSVGLCAAAGVLSYLLAWGFWPCVLLIALMVLVLTNLGGFRATIYSDVLHFALVLMALLPLVPMLVHRFGGIRPMLAQVPSDRMHAWKLLPWMNPQAPLDRVGLFFGLGVVLAISYWSTDFVVMQRILAVRRNQDPRIAVAWLTAAKLLFGVMIVVPGLLAPLVSASVGAGNWNSTLPAVVMDLFPRGFGAIGLVSLAAALVTTFANNISGFSAAWVENIYRPALVKGKGEGHYIAIGRLSNAAAILLSIGAMLLVLHYSSLVEYIQMVFSTFNAPLLALVLLAVWIPQRVAAGGWSGFLAGLGCTLMLRLPAEWGWLHFGSRMALNLYAASVGFSVALCVTLIVGHLHRGRLLPVLPKSASDSALRKQSWATVVVMSLLMLLCLALNFIFW